MRSDWILDVLCDLKRFAEANGLPKLAEQLDDTGIVALSEIASALEAEPNQVDALEHPSL